MTIQELDTPGEHLLNAAATADDFVEAALSAARPLDSHELAAQRVAIAAELAETMQPGAPVLRAVEMYDIRGGVLVAAPTIGGNFSPRLNYTLQVGDERVDESVAMRDFVPTTTPGDLAKAQPPVAGREGVRRAFENQRYRWEHPEREVSHFVPLLLQARTLGALHDAGLPASEFLPAADITTMRAQLVSDLCKVNVNAPLQPDIIRALKGLDGSTDEQIYAHVQEGLVAAAERTRSDIAQMEYEHRVRVLMGRLSATSI